MSSLSQFCPVFTYSVCDLFKRNNKRIQKFMQPVDMRFIYQNDLNEACFQYDMAYGSYKDLVKRTESDI